MIGHLGSRVSALLDGQLSQIDEERAWEHVHLCLLCREAVEHEGWVKTQLAGLTFAPSPCQAPSGLRSSLLDAGLDDRQMRVPSGEQLVMLAQRPRKNTGVMLVGGSALGAAVLGVLALAAAPAQAPSLDRRLPATSVVRNLDTQPAPRLPTLADLTRPTRDATVGVKIDQ